MADPLRLAQENNPERLADYGQRVAAALGLRWEIVVEPGPPVHTPHALAESEWRSGRCAVVLRFQPGFHDLPPEVQRERMTHELVHPLTHRLDDRLFEVREWMPPQTFEMFSRGYRLDVEYLIDHLTSVLAPSMPLPEV